MWGISIKQNLVKMFVVWNWIVYCLKGFQDLLPAEPFLGRCEVPTCNTKDGDGSENNAGLRGILRRY